MKTPSDENHDLIRWLDGEMTAAERSAFEASLKNDPELRHIPVQIISGYDRKKESLELGAFNFLHKPIDRNDLQQAFDNIEEFINKKLKKLLVVEDNQTQSQAIRELIGNGDVKTPENARRMLADKP